MSIVVTRPSVTIDTMECKWNAAHNSIKFYVQRKDVTASACNYVSANTFEVFYASASEAVIGEFVYVACGSLAGLAEITATNVGSITVQITTALNSNQGAGYFNWNTARENYYISTEVSVDSIILGTLVNKPNTAGLAIVDPSSMLKQSVGYTDEFNHNSINERDTNLGNSYTLDFTEYYAAAAHDTDTTTDYFTNSAKQVGDLYGSNMGEYFTYSQSGKFSSTAKFLSDFEKPTYFNGFPFSLSFIFSELCDYHTYNLYRSITKNNYGSSESPVLTSLDSAEVGFVNRLMIGDAGEEFTDQVESIDVHLTTNPNHFSETKNIKINKGCVANPVYLNWLGTNGGRNYWLFNTTQSDVLEVQDTGEFFPQEVDLETDLGNGEYMGMEAQPQLVCSAYLPLEDLRGLKGLLMSPDVLMLTNIDTWLEDDTSSPIAPLPKWRRVRVLPQTYKVLETNQSYALIEVTLLLPTINIQQQ